MGMTLPYLCDRAGVDRFNWHSLRHFAVHLMLARGASLEQVARQVGHDRMTTTDRYAQKLRGPDLETAAFLSEPLKKGKREGEVAWQIKRFAKSSLSNRSRTA
jgi:integrase